MTAPTHIIMALSSCVALQQVTSLRLDIFQILIVLLGSLAPDLDTDGSISKPGKILRRFVGPGIARIIDSLVAVPVAILQSISRHRGLTHWPLLCLIFFISAKYFKINWLLYFSLGYATHLIADFLTVEGIPVFAPINFNKYSAKICKVGTWLEGLIAFSLLAYTLVYGFEFLPLLTQEAYRNMYFSLERFISGLL